MSAVAAQTDLSPAEAGARASRSEQTIKRWIHAGRLPARRHPVSRRLLIDPADLDRVVAAEPVAAEPVEPRSAPANQPKPDTAPAATQAGPKPLFRFGS